MDCRSSGNICLSQPISTSAFSPSSQNYKLNRMHERIWCAKRRMERLQLTCRHLYRRRLGSVDIITVKTEFPDVTWTILTIPLLPFWALNESVGLLSMKGLNESSWISSKISEFVFRRWTKVLRVWDDMSVNNYWQNFLFFVSIYTKCKHPTLLAEAIYTSSAHQHVIAIVNIIKDDYQISVQVV